MKKGSFYFTADSHEKTTVMLASDNHSSTMLDYEDVDRVIVEFAKPVYNLIGYTNVKFLTVTTESCTLLNVNLHYCNVVVRRLENLITIYIFKNKNITEEEKE